LGVFLGYNRLPRLVGDRNVPKQKYDTRLIMHIARCSLITLLLTGFLLSAILMACGGQVPAGQPTPDMEETVAAAAGTLAAALFQTQTAMAPTITNTSPPTVTSLPTNTAMPLPSASVLPSATQAVLYYVSPIPSPTGTFYTATPSSASLASGCYNLRLISSWTEPAGTLLPGQDFTQYWQVENNGTCEWLFVYSAEFVSGDRLSEATSVRLSNRIEPGKWTTLSVNLHAPRENGNYRSSWRFSDGGGKLFGATLPVSITVSRTPEATATPNLAQTAAQQTAVSNAVNTAVAGSATANCAALQQLGTPCP
jgi:hypothetical protein